MNRKAIYSVYIKRLFDIALSLAALILLSPFLLLLWLLVRGKLGRPAVFRQQRPGKDGVAFTLYKFRTMTDKTDGHGDLLPDAERLTDFGKALRRTSLDELPELVNILKGDMSLIGPRPLLMKYLPLYSKEQARRHEVRPGLTGWAQINGRNGVSWEEKFELDVWYVTHISMALDMQILWRSAAVVLGREGISQEGEATMEEFKGGKM
jgi:lipopolysaccharide/colanic/teichoic acid biosynthesis glycosyltransferase